MRIPVWLIRFFHRLGLTNLTDGEVRHLALRERVAGKLVDDPEGLEKLARRLESEDLVL